MKAKQAVARSGCRVIAAERLQGGMYTNRRRVAASDAHLLLRWPVCDTAESCREQHRI